MTGKWVAGFACYNTRVGFGRAAGVTWSCQDHVKGVNLLLVPSKTSQLLSFGISVVAHIAPCLDSMWCLRLESRVSFSNVEVIVMLNNTNICSILCNTQLSAESLLRVKCAAITCILFCMYHQLLTTTEGCNENSCCHYHNHDEATNFRFVIASWNDNMINHALPFGRYISK